MKTRKARLIACLLMVALTIGMFPHTPASAAKKMRLSSSKLNIPVGKTKKLTVKNATKTVKWKILSGKKYILTKKSGKNSLTIKGKKKGTAKIRATVGKKKLTCTVTVKKASKKPTPKPEVTGQPNNQTAAPSGQPKQTAVPTGQMGTAAGLYDSDTKALKKSWDELIADGVIKLSSAGKVLYPSDSSALVGDLVIGGNVTRIGEYAFEECSSLTSVTIPDGVTSIGEWAFFGCNSLTSVTIPDGVVSIKDAAFEECSSLTSVMIPDGVTKIGWAAFYGCSSLTSVTIPDGVTSIKENTFFRCSSLTSVTIPNGVTNIERGAFDETPWLEAQKAENDFVIINNVLISYGKKDSGDIIIPDGVASIGGGAFSGCSGLTSVTIPEGVTSIGAHAFYECSSLTRVMIPEGVTSIGEWAFSKCSSLASVTIPDGITSIKSMAFLECSSLTSVTISDSIKNIEMDAFSETPWLEAQKTENDFVIINNILISAGKKDSGDIIIPDGVINIADYTFDGYSNLTSVTIPDGVTRIGNRAFGGCINLRSVIIPDSVKDIDEYAFSGTLWLEAQREENDFVIVNNILISYGKKNSGHIIIPEGVTSIGKWAFVECSSLTSVTIPDGVTGIGNYAFNGCSSLTNIMMPDSVKNVTDIEQAFYGTPWIDNQKIE